MVIRPIAVELVTMYEEFNRLKLGDVTVERSSNTFREAACLLLACVENAAAASRHGRSRNLDGDPRVLKGVLSNPPESLKELLGSNPESHEL